MPKNDLFKFFNFFKYFVFSKKLNNVPKKSHAAKKIPAKAIIGP